ncbi:hypothetical protein Mapa_010111 [Marchantia paleacea]|nr:hypothetical protein Mapa_010111 [Marchantia paleacea]
MAALPGLNADGRSRIASSNEESDPIPPTQDVLEAKVAELEPTVIPDSGPQSSLPSAKNEDAHVFKSLYERLGPRYKPFPDEEASIADLLQNMKSNCRPLQHLEREPHTEIKGQCSCSRNKRKLGISTRTDEFKPGAVGFMVPPVQPSRNFVNVKGGRIAKPYLRSPDRSDDRSIHRKRSEEREQPLAPGLKAGNDEHEGRTKLTLERCSCCQSSKLDAGKMKKWRAFELRYTLLLDKLSPVKWRQSVFVTAHELQQTLRHWHTSLKLDNASSCIIAFHVYQRRVRTLKHSYLYSLRGLNVTLLLAVSLWVAVKLVDNSAKVPKASRLAAATGVPVKLIMVSELPLLDALHWNLVRF